MQRLECLPSQWHRVMTQCESEETEMYHVSQLHHRQLVDILDMFAAASVTASVSCTARLTTSCQPFWKKECLNLFEMLIVAMCFQGAYSHEGRETRFLSPCHVNRIWDGSMCWRILYLGCDKISVFSTWWNFTRFGLMHLFFNTERKIYFSTVLLLYIDCLHGVVDRKPARRA